MSSFQTAPFHFRKKQLFGCSIKTPRRPRGQPMMTFPDGLPYGESNIPDAFAMYSLCRSTVTSTPGTENGVVRTRHVAQLPVQLCEQTAQKPEAGLGALRGPCVKPPGEVTSCSPNEQSRWRTRRQGMHLCGKADLSLSAQRGV